MAQTMQNASFGPVFLIAGQPNPLRLFIMRIGPKKKVRMNKNKEKKKKTYLWPKQRKTLVWARFRHCTFFCYLVAKPKIQIKDQLAKKNERNKKNMYLLWQCCRGNVCNYVLSAGLRKMPSQHYTYRIYYLNFTKPLGEVVFIAVLPAQWPWVQFLHMLFFYLLVISTWI